MDTPFTDVPGALAEIRAGRMVVVVDDEDRENEGDLTLAAQHVTPEAINFMARYGRGLICLALDAGLSRGSQDFILRLLPRLLFELAIERTKQTSPAIQHLCGVLVQIPIGHKRGRQLHAYFLSADLDVLRLQL